ncbi:MAG TPA: diguanylate cyclase response regulator [Gemmatimonadales bacterium]|nr:diguanylate cyclase response regulator [Gemmatimonadales bacterium]
MSAAPAVADTILACAPIQVLLVEDSPVDALLVGKFLTAGQPGPRSYTVATAASRAAAVERLEEGAVDLVLLDLNLPDSVGLDTFLAIRDATTATVVVLSGMDDEATSLEAVRLGAQDYLVKGQFSAGLLRRAVCYAVERARLQREVAELSLVDELTGLRNLRGFRLLAEEDFRAALRRRTEMGMAFVDLDGLKNINDVFGRAVGDAAIQGMASVLRATFREADLIVRIGGDEFAVLLRDIGTDLSLEAIRARLTEQLDRFNGHRGRPYRLEASLGFAHRAPEQDTSIEALMAAADAAIYCEKMARKAGRGVAPPPPGPAHAASAGPS